MLASFSCECKNGGKVIVMETKVGVWSTDSGYKKALTSGLENHIHEYHCFQFLFWTTEREGNSRLRWDEGARSKRKSEVQHTATLPTHPNVSSTLKTVIRAPYTATSHEQWGSKK